MIPQLPSRNRTPRQREHTGGSSSSTFLTSERSFGHSRSKLDSTERTASRRETITYKHEWRIDDITQLAAHVEGLDEQLQPVPRGQEGEVESTSEILRTGRKTADEMYKFDLGVTTDENGTPESRCLSLYICCLLRAREAYHSPAFTSNIFIGIIGSPKSGQEHGATTYLWTHQERYTFQPHDDFTKVRLPTLSTLARDTSVIKENAITICIRIEQEYGEQPNFQREGHVQVPNDLVSALGSLIDVPNGADVKFVCLEHEIERDDTAGGGMGDEPGLKSRKRVIYANSQILSKRSSYFEDLFATSFLETAALQSDQFKTVVVESADFNTVYWMLRFLYTNELLFDEQHDHIQDLMVQHSIEPAVARQALTGPSLHHPPSHEWQWRSLDGEFTEPLSAVSSSDHDPDTRSISSSNHSFATSSTVKTVSTKSSIGPTASSNAKASPRHGHKSDSTSPNRQSRISSRASSESYPSSRTVGPSKTYPPRIHTQATDPHDHPVKEPAPACAMAIYMLAHQYRLDALVALARKHILSHLTHSTCIPVFLASYRYTDLHEQVLQYIHSEWKDVKGDGEFVRCFQEVARGVWGEEGGTLLADMVSRLPY